MSKRALILLLAGINVLLLATLLFTTLSPPAAYAQAAAAARKGEMMVVSARPQVGTDALWVVDGGSKQLHVFVTNYPRQGGERLLVRQTASREFAPDFQPAGGRR